MIDWLLLTISAAVVVEPLPSPVRAMIEAAIDGGDAATIDSTIALARKTNPYAAAEIDAIEKEVRARRDARVRAAAEERQARIAEAGLLDNWKGQVEFGGSRSTGNSRTLGLYGALSGEREGLHWRHKFAGRADLQEASGITTTQRALASWQPHYKFDERLYAYGLAQYEHDRFLGFDNRYTASGGMGYGVVATQSVKIDIEGGPALRHVDSTTGPNTTALAGRASMSLGWKITPTLQLTQTGALYLESGDNSATATTALDTKLIGDLKARFSYNVQYERDAPRGVRPVDTLTRATLVYSF